MFTIDTLDGRKFQTAVEEIAQAYCYNPDAFFPKATHATVNGQQKQNQRIMNNILVTVTDAPWFAGE